MHVPMRRYEREVVDPQLIVAMLRRIHVMHLGMTDDGGLPYVVPLNYGFEVVGDLSELRIYFHGAREGFKSDVLRLHPRACCEFSEWTDFFPCGRYRGHQHDYRSVIANGTARCVDRNDFDAYVHAMNLIHTCNGRPPYQKFQSGNLPPMDAWEVRCPMDEVSAKVEWPVQTIEDVPLVDPSRLPDDTTPLDLSDIVESRKARLRSLGYEFTDAGRIAMRVIDEHGWEDGGR